MQIWAFLTTKYIYIVGAGIAIISIIDMIEACKSKKWWKVALFLILIGVTVIAPIQQLLTHTVIKHEEFSTAKNNVRFLSGKSGNIIFTTAETIEEPVDLRVKDNWAHLTYLTDYELLDDRNVRISYEFGNNDAYNKSVAANGLMFTYKTRRMK